MVSFQSKIGHSLKFILGVSLLLFVSCKSQIREYLNLYMYKAHTYQDPKCSRALHYRLFSPTTQENKRYPLILFLHGGAERGNDNKSQINYLSSVWIKNDFQKPYPSYVLAPQCPKDMEWVTIRPKKVPFGHYKQDLFPEGDEMKSIISLIQKMIKEKPIDSTRIYVVGFSMGASGTWDIMTRYPNFFAASIVVTGENDTTKAHLLKNTPIWAFCGEHDTIVPPIITKDMVKAVSENGGNIKFTLIEDVDHYMGHLAFNYPGAKEWLMSNVKKN